MPVTVDELVNSPRYSGTAKELTAVREFIIDWADINTFYLELFPAASGDSPSLPALMTGSTVLYADSVEFAPFHPDGDQDFDLLATYTYAKATVTYKTVPYERSGGDDTQILTRRIERTGEFLTLKNTGVKWDGDAAVIKDPDVTAGFVVPSAALHVTMHRVTPNYKTTLIAAVNDLIGKVNAEAWEGFPAECALFEGANFEQGVTADGTQPWQVDLRFNARIVANVDGDEFGWNYFFDESPGQGKWRRMKTADDKDIYKLGDFNQFYQPAVDP